MPYCKEGNRVISRTGQHEGTVVSVCPNRHCGVEDCRGKVLCVRWDDGMTSYPCTGGMEHVEGDTFRIVPFPVTQTP